MITAHIAHKLYTNIKESNISKTDVTLTETIGPKIGINFRETY